MSNIEIIRDDNPRCLELGARGCVVVAESWAARLRLDPSDDLERFRKVVEKVQGTDFSPLQLEPDYAKSVFELEIINHGDYPDTPATAHPFPTMEKIEALWNPDNLVFGILKAGKLMGVLATSRRSDLVELDFASVLREFRGLGFGKALASQAILEWASRDESIFGTGGAMQNEASLGTVLSLGFTIEERWRSYRC